MSRYNSLAYGANFPPAISASSTESNFRLFTSAREGSEGVVILKFVEGYGVIVTPVDIVGSF